MDTAPPPGSEHQRDPNVALRLLVERVREYAIFQLDPEGHVATWNMGAERIKQYRAEEILGKHFSVFYPPEDVAAGKCEMELEIARRTGKYEEEGWRVRKDNTRFWAAVLITALFDEDGYLIGFGKVTRDMTERRRAEQQLRHARAEAEHANHAKTEFLSRMSHELRTPLTAILGFAELLQDDGNLDPKHQKWAGSILNAGEHLLRLINEVLEISRIESGTEDFQVDKVLLAPIVDEAVALMRPLATPRGITIDAEVPGALRVEADAQRLSQVLINLISNAIKYNTDSGTVEITTDGPAGMVRIYVRDTGLGIAEPLMGRVFEPFDRLGAERLNIPGAGLGLALSKRLVEGMGGRIGLSSEHGRGTTFWVDFPAADAPAAEPWVEPGASRPDTDTDAGTGSASRTILYIEDDVANIAVFEGFVAKRPELRLLTATEGHQGLEMARTYRPDLIFLDIHLPDIGGDRVLAALRATAPTQRTPIVMLTADATPEQRQTFLDAGADEYLTKPLRMANLFHTIDNYVRIASAK